MMLTTPTLPDEAARLDALSRAAILDTGPEDFFEDLIESVNSTIAAPIALISLIDENRQWFKARRGVSITEMPRNRSICEHALFDDAPLVVPDAHRDRRFADNPLVAGPPHLSAYLGAPIVLSCGARLGTVCVLDHAPCDWSAGEIAHVQRAARMAARHIEARRASIEKDRLRFLELALTQTEIRYRTVIDAMSEGMVIMGPSGAIIDSNPAACEILGLTDNELFGRVSRDPRWRAVHPSGQDFPGETHPVMVTLRTGEPQHDVPMGIVTPDGERRWIAINSYPVRRTQDGRVDQAVAVFRVTGIEGRN